MCLLNRCLISGRWYIHRWYHRLKGINEARSPRCGPAPHSLTGIKVIKFKSINPSPQGLGWRRGTKEIQPWIKMYPGGPTKNESVVGICFYCRTRFNKYVLKKQCSKTGFNIFLPFDKKTESPSTLLWSIHCHHQKESRPSNALPLWRALPTEKNVNVHAPKSMQRTILTTFNSYFQWNSPTVPNWSSEKSLERYTILINVICQPNM